MPRRSLRLESNGYYTQREKPPASYKELKTRVFKSKKRLNRCSDSSIRSSSTFNSTNNTTESTAHAHTGGQCQSQSLVNPRMAGCFCLMVLLCCGFSYGLVSGHFQALTVHGNALYEDLIKQLRTLQSRCKELEDNVDYLQPFGNKLPNLIEKSLGAYIVQEYTSETYVDPRQTLKLFGKTIWKWAVSPKLVLLETKEPIPGQCWPFKGAQGHVTIYIPQSAVIRYVSLGHIPKNLSPSGAITSAPKEFTIYGLESKDAAGIKLGTFLYDEDGNHLQTFEVSDHGNQVFRYVRLQIESNWGNPESTCLYSFKVHGQWNKDEDNLSCFAAL